MVEMSTLQVLSEVTPRTSLFQKERVDRSYSGFDVALADQSDWQRRDLLIQAHQEWKERIEKVNRIMIGDWFRVWPDLSREPMAPTVANTIEMATTHFSAIGGSMVPSIRVPVPIRETGPEGERGAAKRARRLRELEEKSNIHKLLSYWFGDYQGTGAAAAFIWTDFSKPEEERHPMIFRLDPRHYYPVVSPQGEVLECLVARKVHSYELSRNHPEIEKQLDVDSIVEEWYWFEKDRIRHMLVDVSPKGRKEGRGWTLVEVPNETGLVPVIEIVRPTFDGERRGAHDQTIHIMRVQHHLMGLTIERTEEETYPGIAAYDVDEPDMIGPGATVTYRSSEGRIDRLTPDTHFDVKDLIARLEAQARFQSVYPVQLTGDPGASIASARAITASQGALDARLAQAHRDFEWFLTRIDASLLRFDEAYCNAPKEIYGDSHDRKKPESFFPERDIAGAYEVSRSYGLGAGADPTNRETRLQLHLSSGLISKKRARQELDFLENDDEEEKQFQKEQMMTVVQQGIAAQASQGQTEIALMYFELLNNPDLTMEEVLIEFGKRQKEMQEAAAAAAQEATVSPGGPGIGGGPLGAASAAESLARGGIPGNAEGLPAGAGLPPIAQPGAPAQVL